MPHLESKTKLIMTANVNRYINPYFKQHKQLAPQSKAPFCQLHLTKLKNMYIFFNINHLNFDFFTKKP